MTPSLPIAMPLFLSTIHTVAATPLSLSPRTITKRTPSSHTIGIGFAIALTVILFAIIIFYLGVRRGQTGTWFCWRDPPLPSRSPTALSEKISVIYPEEFKTRISCPVPIHSSALPELSPVEAGERSPKYLELSSDCEKAMIYEMGEPSPRRPLSSATQKTSVSTKLPRQSYLTAARKSVFDLKSRAPRYSWNDRKSWFCKSAQEVECEEKRLRGKDSFEEPLAYPAPAFTRDRERGRESGAHSGMDWTGMEWIQRVYARKSGFKSGVRSFHPRDER